MDNKLKVLLTLLCMLAAVVQLFLHFIMLLLPLCAGSKCQTPARACPVCVNGHMICSQSEPLCMIFSPLKLLSAWWNEAETKQLARVHVHQERNVVYILPRPTVGVSSNKNHSVRGTGCSNVGENGKDTKKMWAVLQQITVLCASSRSRFASTGVLRH